MKKLSFIDNNLVRDLFENDDKDKNIINKFYIYKLISQNFIKQCQ